MIKEKLLIKIKIKNKINKNKNFLNKINNINLIILNINTYIQILDIIIKNNKLLI